MDNHSHAQSYTKPALAGSQAVFTSYKFFLYRGRFVYYLVECYNNNNIK